MKTIKKILCAVDFSEATAPVSSYAVLFANALGASIEVLYVAPDLQRYNLFEVPSRDIDSFVDNIIGGAEKNMRKCLDTEFANTKAHGVVRTGYAPQKILEYAEETGAEAIIIGSHGRRGVDRIVFGSVAEKVVKQSRIPVVTVPVRHE
ncbi:universal stress protein [Oceanidesulfovibrio marinus]|uniref:Universal stress protein n=1 Tax=Oceanidesulfovibrio marinus TaxID=370038 RepID=A0A6P1ZKZ7_9BACT|nr:universal stress protein [Oceanidesulfovibrio marinus]QJT10106.1 universal stress protein [Oceanidesulfovibrio marinus]TVM35779.1 universal stress protein [Oceanidesulfovibrio marinus]